MHILGLLHKTFSKASDYIDKRNHKTLLKTAVTLCNNKHLSITALGRNLKSRAKVKHNIKRIDRLFGNSHVQNSRTHYYRQVAEIVIGSIARPCITIDWSGLTPCGEFHLLRAACPVKGRAITLFEQSYRESEYMKQKIHLAFIQNLKAILPKHCQPVIVTDAGFRNPWFKLIRTFDWDFVGRVRHQTQYNVPETETWLPIKTLYKKSAMAPTYLFETRLAKANSLTGHLYLYKAKPKKRKHKNLRGRPIRSSVSLKHAKGATEPWLIFSSLCREHYSPACIIKIYGQRMQIEESFRDLKNTNNGLNLRHCRSYQKGRLNVALLIALIASFILWIAGLTAKLKHIHHSFQVNTVKNRDVLSCFSLGVQFFQRYGFKIRLSDFNKAISQLNLNCQSCL